MAGKETRYKDAYELIDRQKDDGTKKEFRKLSRRRPAKTLRTIAAGVAFLLTVTALVLVVAFRIDTVNKIEKNQENQGQINELSSAQKTQQDNVNDQFEELLNDFNEDIHNRLNNSHEVIEAFKNVSNLTVNVLRLQLREEIQELFLQLNMSNENIRKEVATADQTLQNQVNNLNEDIQEEIAEERQVREELFTTLQNQQHQANDSINSLGLQLEQQIENIGSKITNISEAILVQMNSSQSKIINSISKLQCPGLNQHNPAISCQQVIECNFKLNNAFYWLSGADNSSTSLVYCDFDWTCEYHNITGPWRRVKYLDMRNNVHTCPEELRTRTNPSPSCAIHHQTRGSCQSVILKTDQIRYDKVCGKIIGLRRGNPDGFRGENNNLGYVDGISLTYSNKHIWTFTSTTRFSDNCACDVNRPVSNVESVTVGTDYFCNRGGDDRFVWDATSCDQADSCCMFNQPPWFYQQLSQSTTRDIEMRLCFDEGSVNEDIGIEQLELYVQ